MILSAEEYYDNGIGKDFKRIHKNLVLELMNNYTTYKLKALIEEVLSDERIDGIFPREGAKWAKSDLRIGNWVESSDGEFDPSGKFKQIDPMDFNPDWTTFYHPIPLTPDWLERGGFEENVHRGVWYSNGYWDVWDNNDGTWRVTTQVRPIIDTDIQYVHQLQNLYFCLTSTELEFKM